MKTVSILIGNSDDKLSQVEWSAFIHKANKLIGHRAKEIYFNGFSVPMAIWQNACWVFEIPTTQYLKLQDEMKRLRVEFKQDSIAWIDGVTVFLD